MVEARLPVLTKNWQLDVNNVAGTNSTSLADHRATLFAIKSSLISFIDNPWTVHSSSNAITADASDNWTAASDLVWDTGNHSWIVLIKPTTGSQALFNLNETDSRNMEIYWSLGGLFTGGTISARPTATDEITIQTGGFWSGGLQAANTWVHVWHEDTGARTRVLVSNDISDPLLFWILDEIANTFSDNWSDPEIFCIFEGPQAVSNEVMGDVPVVSTAAKAVDNSTELDVSLTGFGYETVSPGFGGTNWITEQEAGQVANELGNNIGFPICPILATVSTIGGRGVHGIVSDVFFGADALSVGTTYPNNTFAKQFAQAGRVVLPWTNDDTIPLFDATAAENTADGHFMGTGSSLERETTFYRMVGIDSGAPVDQYPFYVYWTASIVPDVNGEEAGTLPFGGPLIDIAISFEFTEVR